MVNRANVDNLREVFEKVLLLFLYSHQNHRGYAIVYPVNTIQPNLATAASIGLVVFLVYQMSIGINNDKPPALLHVLD